MSKQQPAREYVKGDKVRDVYTGEVYTVKRSYWQAYAGEGDYTVEFEPTATQPTPWNKSRNLMPVEPEMPDWMRPMSPAELEREAMDYEFNAAYDRYDGFGDPDYGDEYDDFCEAAEFVPYVEPARPLTNDEVPF